MNYEEGQQVTRRWLIEAGVGPGQRVLDLGTGPGSVAALVLDLVGPTGDVVGLDRSGPFLTMARERLAGRPYSAREVDLDGPLPDDLGTFDVVVERRVLMYLQRPAAALARAAAHLRPGGLAWCQGFVLDPTPTALPLHDTVLGWMVRMLEFESASWTFGRELPRVFREAGLPPPVMRADVDVASPGQPDSLVDRIRFVVPRLVEAGIPAEVIDLDTLAARLSAERDRVGAPWFADMAVAAWARTPAV
ncbi:MAG: methyltransferase domain-containing protein [Nannocystis sp.]|nr:methyltransferase domain-containing protein [Nannocystis sp.]